MVDTTERVERLLDGLAREEKLRLVSGTADPDGTATGYLPGVGRLDDRAFARYDPEDGWVTDDGTYAVEVARSSRDVRTTVETER